MSKERLGILASGSGTTAEHTFHSLRNGEVDMELACVLTHKRSAGVIRRMMDAGFEKENIVVVERGKYRRDDGGIDEEGFGQEINKELRKRGVTVVTQNGFTVHTPDIVIQSFPDAIFNQHPGSLPDFAGVYGRQVHAATIFFRKRAKSPLWTESVFHRVWSEVDAGPVVKSRRIEFNKNDSVEDLKEKVLPIEHELQIELLQDIVHRSVREEPRVTLLKPGQETLLEESKQVARILYPRG